MRCVIIDDEPAARRKLRRMLADYAQVNVVGEADDLASAVSVIKTEKPDLVFLDINLSGENGFDLLARLGPSALPNIVFVTAFDSYAVEAFGVDALDYLVKPIHPDRLQRCIEKAAKALSSSSDDHAACTWVLESAQGHKQRVSGEQIQYIQAQGDYTLVQSSAGEFLVRKTVKAWQTELQKTGFVRVSRSLILSLKAIQKMSPSEEHVQIWFCGLDQSLLVSASIARRIKQKL